jgi:hypothetical protein
MVVVKLIGGLGNQMFQYAFAKALALSNNVELKFELSFFNKIHHDKNVAGRNFQLDVFDINEPIATKKEVFSLTQRTPYYLVDKVLNKLIGTKKSYILEKDLKFNGNLIYEKPPIILEGFWQSEKYFKNNNQVLSYFQFAKELNQNSIAVLNKILRSNSVSIHIRRTDYILNNKTYEIWDIGYYNKAIEFIKASVIDPVFFLFTDDYHWAKTNLISDENFILVEGNVNDDSWMDMRLMSNCKHNIIANSSFSWWGARLNRNENRIIITPQKWYKKDNLNTMDLVPADWVRL